MGQEGSAKDSSSPLSNGNFSVKGQWKDGFRIPYSLVKLADFQPGYGEGQTQMDH